MVTKSVFFVDRSFPLSNCTYRSFLLSNCIYRSFPLSNCTYRSFRLSNCTYRSFCLSNCIMHCISITITYLGTNRGTSISYSYTRFILILILILILDFIFEIEDFETFPTAPLEVLRFPWSLLFVNYDCQLCQLWLSTIKGTLYDNDEFSKSSIDKKTFSAAQFSHFSVPKIYFFLISDPYHWTGLAEIFSFEGSIFQFE